MSSGDLKKVAIKIIKKLKSKDDNDKLAALTYLTKAFKTPEDLSKSEYCLEIWSSLRSTQFLERALRSEDTQNLVFLIVSTFSHFCPSADLDSFVPLLSKIMKDDYKCEACQCLIEVSQNIEDVSILFEYNELNVNSLSFFAHSLLSAKKCTLTASVCSARVQMFTLFASQEDLEVRKLLFILISHIVQANDSFALYSAKSKIDITGFLAAERLALIELRLQLDVPLNYKELEENEKAKNEEEKILNKDKKPKNLNPYPEEEEDQIDIENIEPIHKEFTQNIGSLINPEMSSAACQLLELLVLPLINHEEELNDNEVSDYFECIDSMLKETISIFNAVIGQRDNGRSELKCLISIFARWMREGPFLCENAIILRSMKNLLTMLWWFPNEALQCAPAFRTWAESENARPLMKGNFNELASKMKEVANEEENSEIANIVYIVYK